MKKLLFTLLTLALAAPNYAQDFSFTSEEGVEIWFTLLDGETCMTAEETCIDPDTEGKLTIPSEVYDYAVVAIGDFSFEDCEYLTEIVLPSTIQSIGERAFYNTGLVKLTLGENDIEYANGCFSFCSDLKEVYTTNQNPSAISSSVFPTNNEGLTLYVPAGTKEVYENTAGWNSFPNIVEMGGATAIQDVNGTKAVTSVKYHNLAGMVSDRPFDGVNIVTTTRADGTTTTTKVLR